MINLMEKPEEGIRQAAEVIKNGGIVAFPTETVYGLGADAQNPDAVKKIFEAKGRPQDNPLIVHIYRIEDVEQLAKEISPLAWNMMRKFWPGPFTAVLKKQDSVPDVVSGGLDTIGIRLPENKLARELIKESGKFIAAPSANLSGKPSPTEARHVYDDMKGRIPIILDGGSCEVGLESTVCDLTGEIPVILRPGGITPEMIEEEAGIVKISPAVLGGLKKGENAASPGMKYKHYAPKAKVLVARGNDINTIAKKIISRYDIDVRAKKRVAIICPESYERLYGTRKVFALDSQNPGKGLFSTLRHADEENIETIYFHAVREDGLGLAVMNRIIRAAEFRTF